MRKWILPGVISLLLTGAIFIYFVFFYWGVPYFEAHFSFGGTVLPFVCFFFIATLLLRLIFSAVEGAKTASKMTPEERAAAFAERQTRLAAQQAMSTVPVIGHRSGMSTAQLPRNKEQAELLSKQWLKQAVDSVKIINTTKKPNVFFERCDFYLDTLERLAYCERWVRFSGELPSTKLRFSQDELTRCLELFILRYSQDTREKIYQLSTPKGKANKADAFYKTMNEYADRLDVNFMQLVNEEYEKLKQLSL